MHKRRKINIFLKIKQNLLAIEKHIFYLKKCIYLVVAVRIDCGDQNLARWGHQSHL